MSAFSSDMGFLSIFDTIKQIDTVAWDDLEQTTSPSFEQVILLFPSKIISHLVSKDERFQKTIESVKELIFYLHTPSEAD